MKFGRFHIVYEDDLDKYIKGGYKYTQIFWGDAITKTWTTTTTTYRVPVSGPTATTFKTSSQPMMMKSYSGPMVTEHVTGPTEVRRMVSPMPGMPGMEGEPEATKNDKSGKKKRGKKS